MRCKRNDSFFLENRASSSSTRDSSSDSDAETLEKCPVCLKALKAQVLAITDTCVHHTFCLTCLQQWSKIGKTCPVDRIPFDSILVLDSKGYVAEELPVKIANVGRYLFVWNSFFTRRSER